MEYPAPYASMMGHAEDLCKSGRSALCPTIIPVKHHLPHLRQSLRFLRRPHLKTGTIISHSQTQGLPKREEKTTASWVERGMVGSWNTPGYCGNIEW